jgi:hypothetical protein
MTVFYALGGILGKMTGYLFFSVDYYSFWLEPSVMWVDTSVFFRGLDPYVALYLFVGGWSSWLCNQTILLSL